MKKTRIFISLILAGVLIFSQVSAVLAAPAGESNQLISGTVQKITLEADPSTGVTIVAITVVNENGQPQVVRVALEIASALGLVTQDGDGNPVINQSALGQVVEIDSDTIISQEKQHPVGNALSTFFSDIEGLDYDAIMQAHETGNGFGVIAQVLWLTRKLDGDASVFLSILTAKQNNDFSDFTLTDGSSPTNWGQLKKAILGSGKNGNLGLVMSDKNKNDNHNGNSNNGNGNGNANNNGNNKNKDKEKDKNNNGNGGGNGNGNGNGKKP